MVAKLIDAGLDYLRVTAQDDARKTSMRKFFWDIAKSDERLGYKVAPGGCFGFMGEKTRHALWGVKGDWALVQVSGYEAKRGHILANPGTQASRIDIQVTASVGAANVADTLRNLYNAACAYTMRASRPPAVTMIEHRKEIQTVYIGRRASDIFLRAYDKFAESGKEEFKGCVRYEVELKGRASKAVWQKLVTREFALGDLLSLLVTIFKDRGVVIEVDELEPRDVRLPPKERTREEGTVAWLVQQVAPVVKRFSIDRGWIMPFSLLFDSACSEFDRGRIMHTLALLWGS